MNEYHDISGLLLLSAVIVGVVTLYVIGGLIGVVVAATAIDLVLRRIEARRAEAVAIQAEDRRKSS